MAVISDQYKYIFLAEPHTASRAMRDALIATHGAREIGHHHITRVDLHRRSHLSPRQKKYKTFTVIRHPFDVIVTKFYFQKAYKHFKDYLRAYLVQPFEFVHSSCALPVDHTIYYEALAGGLYNVMEELNAPVPELALVGKTEGKPEHYMDLYDQDDIEFAIKNMIDVPYTL